MQTLILCVAPGPGKNLDIAPALLANAEYATEISDAKGEYDVIWAQDCALSSLFTPEGDADEDFWGAAWEHLKDEGILCVKGLAKFINVTMELQDFSRVVRQLASRFFLGRYQDDTHVFRKILELPRELTIPENLNALLRASKPIASLFDMNPNKEVCELVEKKSKVLLGGGIEGQVFYHPEWRTDVAVKRIRTSAKHIPESKKSPFPNPRGHIYKGGTGFLELLSTSLISELSDGTSRQGFSLHIPRVTGFFTCVNEASTYDVYIISELMQGGLDSWLRKNSKGNVPMVKAVIWQALYAIISINTLNWQHHDASPRNFLISDVKADEVFMNREIGKASRWIYKLERDVPQSDVDSGFHEWSLKNFRKVVKIADFGFLMHLEQSPETWTSNAPDAEFRVTHRLKLASDVNYFMATLAGFFHDSEATWSPLFQEWAGLAGIGVANIMAGLRFAGAGLWSPGLSKAFYATFRTKPEYDSWDTVKLLNSKFFAEVL